MPCPASGPTPLVCRETVEQPRSAGRYQIGLTAAARRVRGIPRAVAAASSIVMAQHHAAATIRVARVIAARGIHVARNRPAERVRSREDVVLVRCVADAVDPR